MPIVEMSKLRHEGQTARRLGEQPRSFRFRDQICLGVDLLKSTMGPTLVPKECQAQLLTPCPEVRQGERVSKKPKD